MYLPRAKQRTVEGIIMMLSCIEQSLGKTGIEIGRKHRLQIKLAIMLGSVLEFGDMERKECRCGREAQAADFEASGRVFVCEHDHRTQVGVGEKFG